MSEEDKKDPYHFYPKELRTENFSADNFRALLPYVLEDEKVYRRSECIRLAVTLHEKITGIKVNQSTEQLGNKIKKVFSQSKDLFQSSKYVHGGWMYVGPSYLGEPQTIGLEIDDTTDTSGSNESSSFVTTRKTIEPSLTIRKTIEASSAGEQTLYVWWHPESEQLAKLEGRTEWAMKIGSHSGRNVENRIQDYKTSIPYKPILGLLVHCKKAITVEKILHTVLRNKGKRIDEMGSEWFLTSVSEIEDILEFNHFI
jgi:hypothetical protein